MSTTQKQREAVLTSPPQARERAAHGWRHPFDTAGGTLALGVLLTIVLFLALRLLSG